LRVRVAGPLAECAPELISYLAKRGYTDHSVTNHVRRLACLSRWMEASALDPAGVDEVLIARMLQALHAAGESRSFTPCSFGLLLGFLRGREIVPDAPVIPPTPIEELLGDYRGYLVSGRSLAPLSLPGYLASAAWFLSDACDDDPDRVAALSARDVASFVRRVAEVRGPASVNTVVVGVRSLLRWFYATAMTPTPLAQATPWLARGHMSTLPRPLEAGHARALLATPDRHILSGLRDIAVLTVLVRLGLRAGEVAAMELDDIDWHKGELNVRSKGGWRDPLPLPVDVGEALVAYLSVRAPRGADRHVFAHVRAPGGPMTMTSVRAVVRQASARAGIADTGTHRLRHGAARAMLAKGAPLHEIGQVLRHRDIATTAIYARVDFAALSSVAQPWPGSLR
jgi:site-specific recombinase XerD